jgi:hypothetical protein
MVMTHRTFSSQLYDIILLVAVASGGCCCLFVVSLLPISVTRNAITKAITTNFVHRVVVEQLLKRALLNNVVYGQGSTSELDFTRIVE